MISRPVVAAATIVFSACNAGDPDGAAAVAQETLRWVRASETACGRPVDHGAKQKLVIAFGAQECLSCDAVGYSLRAIERSAVRRSQVLTVVTPRADVPVVCKFLRGERIHASVLVADSLAWKDRGFVGALRFDIDSALDPKRARFAVRISELLSDTL